jgi:hypothetical protein
MGFTASTYSPSLNLRHWLSPPFAVWISPVNKNYEGPRTAYGDPYHGYWVQDISQLNSKFGTEDDLNDLITELHRRGMYVLPAGSRFDNVLMDAEGTSWSTSS